MKATESSISDSSDDDYNPEEINKETVSVTAAALGCSPFKSIGVRDKVGYAKKKAKSLHAAAKSTLASALQISEDALESPMEAECDKCQDLDILIKLLKEKCAISSKQEQLSILTLAPSSWSIEKTAAEFEVSAHLVRKSRELKNTEGILASPASKRGKKLDASLVQAVKDFYCNDEYSRACPGKKDFVSVKQSSGIRVHEQKRLLLVNLKELHREFTKISGLSIRFSTFCELRPKSCVSVASKGMHSVCVCEQHQNVKLHLSALPNSLEYKTLLSLMACDVEKRECMLRECEKCPGREVIIKYLKQVFDVADMDPGDEVHYKQWLHTDRTALINMTLPVSDYIEKVTDALDNLRHHHYIAKTQAAYLRRLKADIQQGTAIILLDFAENYSFVVQDAVQGHHWNNSQATLHPFVSYYQTGDELKCVNYCIVSDCLQHNATAVHAFISAMIDKLKIVLNALDKLIYFSDVAASQYKNHKNFINLCYHEKDFGVPAEWNFFATSHGKSPCDGISGTMKRLVARASLQAATSAKS